MGGRSLTQRVVGAAVRAGVNDPSLLEFAATALHRVGLIPVGKAGEIHALAERDRGGDTHLDLA
jgi:hypothetical protein